MPTRYTGTDTEKAALDAYIKVWRAAHAMEVRANKHLALHNLTISQFGVLEALYHIGPLSQRQLADKILRSSGNLTMVIDNLERDGLVQRERDLKDRRIMTVSLTERGLELIHSLIPQHIQNVMQVFSALTPEELSQLAELSKRLGLSLVEG
ncbi:MarR family transcriptional regulator [Deinococcus sp. KNUC1210]|uniref:MarR family winged helix-turn-helix transcriptional regulator n=1 Tax=Deinococcus sp. KNUC1210 TaxID=2917691 RepID=UPI001EF0F595|nr:MarR family transcriptional regulator [Deinococcus sp. KNUC1210]ULH16418.1 MarR family transcriptional regulator [Deinococcus sp. KNUC1210]